MNGTTIAAIRKILADAHHKYPAYFRDNRNTSALLADLLYEQEEELRNEGFSLLESGTEIGHFYYRILLLISKNRYNDDIGDQLYEELMRGRTSGSSEFIIALIETAMEACGINGKIFRWPKCPVCGNSLHSYETECENCRVAVSDFERLPEIFDSCKQRLKKLNGDPSDIAAELNGLRCYTEATNAGQYMVDKLEIGLLLEEKQKEWLKHQKPAAPVQPPPTPVPPPAPADPLAHGSFSDVMKILFEKAELWKQILALPGLLLSIAGILVTASNGGSALGDTLQRFGNIAFFFPLFLLTFGTQGTDTVGKRWKFVFLLLQILNFRMLSNVSSIEPKHYLLTAVLFAVYDLLYLISAVRSRKTDSSIVFSFFFLTQINLGICRLYPKIGRKLVRNVLKSGFLLKQSVDISYGTDGAVYPVSHFVIGLGVFCGILLICRLILKKFANAPKWDGYLPAGFGSLLFLCLLNGTLSIKWQVSYRVIGTFAAAGIAVSVFLLFLRAAPGGKLYLGLLMTAQTVCVFSVLYPEEWAIFQKSLYSRGARFGKFIASAETEIGRTVKIFDMQGTSVFQILLGCAVVLLGIYISWKLLMSDHVYPANALYLGLHFLNSVGLLYLGLPAKSMLTTAAAVLVAADMVVFIPYLWGRKVRSAAVVLLIMMFFQATLWMAVFLPETYASVETALPFLQKIYDMIGVRSYEALSLLS